MQIYFQLIHIFDIIFFSNNFFFVEEKKLCDFVFKIDPLKIIMYIKYCSNVCIQLLEMKNTILVPIQWLKLCNIFNFKYYINWLWINISGPLLIFLSNFIYVNIILTHRFFTQLFCPCLTKRLVLGESLVILIDCRNGIVAIWNCIVATNLSPGVTINCNISLFKIKIFFFT